MLSLCGLSDSTGVDGGGHEIGGKESTSLISIDVDIIRNRSNPEPEETAQQIR